MKRGRTWLGLLAGAVAMVGIGSQQGGAQTTQTGAAPAYYIVEFEPTDREGLRPYSERVESTFTPYGGRYIVRGNQVDPLEGQRPKPWIVVIAFDTLERARAWYHSAAYTELRPIRQRSGSADAYIVQGLPN